MSGLFALHAESRRGVSEANRRIAVALRPEMNARKCAFIPTGFFVPYSSPRQRYRKVTIWARVQLVLGLKVVSLVPLVTPFSTAHWTAPA